MKDVLSLNDVAMVIKAKGDIVINGNKIGRYEN